MKKFLLLLPVLFLFGAVSSAQITITSSDMPVSGDSIRMSAGVGFVGMDATLTGVDYTWDYSRLTPITQTIDTFLSVYSTNILYSAIFGLFGKNFSNLAERGVSFNPLPGLSISGVYNFYYNTSKRFEQTGFGGSINGIPAPTTYSPHDTVYHFPLTFGKVDSSNSGYAINVPGLFYFKSKTFRRNEADGWGSLTTPYGTFNTLRVKSIIQAVDSVYLDTLFHGGIKFSVPEQIQYKWLGKGQGEPLLQITTIAGIPIQIIYRDSIRTPFTVGVPLDESTGLKFEVYPNPSATVQSVIYSLKGAAEVQLDVYNMTGTKVAILADERQAANSYRYTLDLSGENFSSGAYLLRLSVNGNSHFQKLLVTK